MWCNGSTRSLGLWRGVRIAHFRLRTSETDLSRKPHKLCNSGFDSHFCNHMVRWSNGWDTALSRLLCGFEPHTHHEGSCILCGVSSETTDKSVKYIANKKTVSTKYKERSSQIALQVVLCNVKNLWMECTICLWCRWRNWKTRRIVVPMGEIPCEFKSHPSPLFMGR